MGTGKTLTVRELINILIDAPNKDGEVEVEYIQKEVEENGNGYEWNQLRVSQAVVHNRGCSLEVHPLGKEHE